jgi:predicted lipoprotein with Yx(FWY)xxD motif
MMRPAALVREYVKKMNEGGRGMRVRTISLKRVAWVACVAAAASLGSARSAEGGVKVATDPKLGKYLTDAKGATLYVFKNDSPGKSACTGPCAEAWPIFHAEKLEVSGDLKADDFGTITREDGMKQTTYKRMPLYYWMKDAKPGDTTGHGVKNVWFVAKP